MKKTFLALLFIIFVGGAYAQTPVILESQYQKLVEEAKNKKSQEETSFRVSNTSDDEQVSDDTQSDSTDSSVATDENTSASNENVTDTNATTNSNSSSNLSDAEKMKKYRERQKRIKGGGN